ncbi:DUF6248 family natural product biosynthesis protein [Streptomyces sp. NPDC055078]
MTSSPGRPSSPAVVRNRCPGGEPCVWWCRCPCPENGPKDAPGALPETAGTADSSWLDGATVRGGRRRARGEMDEAQYTLF